MADCISATIIPEPAAISSSSTSLTNFRPRIGALPLFSDAELQRLTMPVLLLAGEQDALLPSAKTAARLQALLPHVTIRLLPEAGHVLANMAPEIVPFLAA